MSYTATDVMYDRDRSFNADRRNPPSHYRLPPTSYPFPAWSASGSVHQNMSSSRSPHYTSQSQRLPPPQENTRKVSKDTLPSNALLFTPVMPKNIGVPYHQHNRTEANSTSSNNTIAPSHASSHTFSQSSQNSTIRAHNSFSGPLPVPFTQSLHQPAPQIHVHPPPSQPQPMSQSFSEQSYPQMETDQAHYEGSFYVGPQYSEHDLNVNAAQASFTSTFPSQPLSSSSSLSPTSWETNVPQSNMRPSVIIFEVNTAASVNTPAKRPRRPARNKA